MRCFFMKLDIEISKRIRELRLSKKMTQEQLAEKIGWDISMVGGIERGTRSNLQIKTLDKIIEALEVDYTTFFSFEDRNNNKLNQLIYEISISENQDALIEVIEKIIDLNKKSN